MAEIDWRMSARLANVARGDSDLPEVTSLEGAAKIIAGTARSMGIPVED